jgi:hypothetical protein
MNESLARTPRPWVRALILILLAFAWGGLAWQLIGIPGRTRAASAWAPAKRMQLG